MDSRIIMFVMSLMTFIAYPFLSSNERKHVAPLATTPNEVEDQDDTDDDFDDDESISMEDDDDRQSDSQINQE